jgi:hypothetical protein
MGEMNPNEKSKHELEIGSLSSRRPFFMAAASSRDSHVKFQDELPETSGKKALKHRCFRLHASD